MNLQITAEELKEKLCSEAPPHLLDVREVEENAYAALPNSTLIPLGEIAFRVDELEEWKDEDIVVYCHHGIRSLNAIGQLRHFGFSKLRNLAGGIDRWSTAVDKAVPRY